MTGRLVRQLSLPEARQLADVFERVRGTNRVQSQGIVWTRSIPSIPRRYRIVATGREPYSYASLAGYSNGSDGSGSLYPRVLGEKVVVISLQAS